MSHDYDVIVVGAGFAGATAARECATRGLRTLVLEGRTRVGGRTWTSALANGDLIDLGGTYVYWSQPHIWSEIVRYGLEDDLLGAALTPEKVLVPVGDGLEWTDPAGIPERERAMLDKYFSQSREVFPDPWNPLAERAAVDVVDKMSIQDRLDQLDLDPADEAYLSRWISAEAQRPAAEGGYLFFLRVWANAGHETANAMDALYGRRLRNGTKSVIDAILADGGSEVRLGEKVTKVDTSGVGVTVSTAKGQVFTASAVVVATPPGVWPHIEFTPGLSEPRLAAATEGLQTPQGNKILAVLRGEPKNIYVVSRGDHPIGLIWTSFRREGDEQVVEVFPTPALKDAHDHDSVRAGIKDLLPHVEVGEVASATYDLDDEFSRGSWPYFQRGQFLKYEPHEKLSQPESGGRVAFACSEVAKGWSGFIDGAIESGLRASRQVRTVVGNGAGQD